MVKRGVANTMQVLMTDYRDMTSGLQVFLGCCKMYYVIAYVLY